MAAPDMHCEKFRPLQFRLRSSKKSKRSRAKCSGCTAGEVSNDIFKPFRLQYGIYGQRQPGVQMVRIKIPFGGLTANQLRRVAEMADRYTTGVGHVTTRQDIQLHFAMLEDVPTIMRKLAEVGLTTREACANTVRNVTACHLGRRLPRRSLRRHALCKNGCAASACAIL